MPAPLTASAARRGRLLGLVLLLAAALELGCGASKGIALDGGGDAAGGGGGGGGADGGDGGASDAQRDDARADDAGARDAGDAAQGADGPPGTCPAALVPCIAALQALRAACPGGGACQRQVETSSRRENHCYADGVRVYLDPGTTAVLQASGRLCYTVSGGLAGTLIDQTVLDPSGAAVIRVTRTLGLTHETVTCGATSVELPDGDHPCGDTALQPDGLACVSGSCLRP